MTTELIVAILPYVISATTSFSVAAYSWRHRKVIGASYYSIVALCWGLMTTGYILEMLSPTLSGKITWDDFQFYPSFVVPIALLAFTVRYTDKELQHPRLLW